MFWQIIYCFFMVFFYILALLVPTSDLTGQFQIQNVVPQESGECAKVKVKVQVNVHGVFSVSSASSVETVKTSEVEEPMETEQTGKEEEVSVCVCGEEHSSQNFCICFVFPPLRNWVGPHLNGTVSVVKKLKNVYFNSLEWKWISYTKHYALIILLRIINGTCPEGQKCPFTMYLLDFCHHVRTKCKWTKRIRKIRLEIEKRRNQRLRRWR